MKTEINNETKAKFFALYYDQPVLFTCSFVKGQHLANILNGKDELEYGQKAYLALKRLSQISDDDLLYLSDITGLFTIEYLVDALQNQSKYVMDVRDSQHVIDYLRSKGYALPYMGISVEQMIQEGWIKLI